MKTDDVPSKTTVAYETAVRCEQQLRIAHSLLTDVISSLRYLDGYHGDKIFRDLIATTSKVDEAAHNMAVAYRELRPGQAPTSEGAKNEG